VNQKINYPPSSSQKYHNSGIPHRQYPQIFTQVYQQKENLKRNTNLFFYNHQTIVLQPSARGRYCSTVSQRSAGEKKKKKNRVLGDLLFPL